MKKKVELWTPVRALKSSETSDVVSNLVLLLSRNDGCCFGHFILLRTEENRWVPFWAIDDKSCSR